MRKLLAPFLSVMLAAGAAQATGLKIEVGGEAQGTIEIDLFEDVAPKHVAQITAIAEVLDTTPAAARKLASRARAKLRPPAVDASMADWEIVDAFMTAARCGEFDRLLALLAPDVVVTADDAAVLAGTPERIVGRSAVADFFDMPRCRCSAAGVPATRGSTGATRPSPSTSPWPGESSPGWSSGRTPTPWPAWCAVRARTRGPEQRVRGVVPLSGRHGAR